jgi:D-psicose/D-tagatose/L-ribulose 3-epimerase
MLFAICNEIFEDRSLDDGLTAIADAGYQGVELAPFTLGAPPAELSARRREAIRSSAEDRGLVVTGMHWLLARTEGMHVSSAEPATIARTRQRLAELSRLCADLGGRVLVFGSPGQRSTPPGMPVAEARERAIETFRTWASVAEAHGVTICLEALPPDETDFMTTTAEVLDIVRAVDSPTVRLVLDVKSMSSEGRDIPSLIRSASAELAYVQANDANRGGPGFGNTDFVPILTALSEVGYDGVVSVEAFDVSSGPDDVAVRSLEYLRRCVVAAETTIKKEHLQ